MTRIVLFLYFIATHSVVYAEIVNISGKVIDADSGSPLPYAHIFVVDAGSVSNSEGEFNLAIDEELLNYSLKVSYIGYNPSTISLSSLESYTDLTISLKAISYELEGVQVRSGSMVMQNVINRIDYNYEYAHQSTLCYFKEKLSSQISKYYIAEGIMDIYLPNNYSTNDIQVSIVRSRKKTLQSELKDEFVLIKGHASDMIQSIVWRDDSFLDPRMIKHYDFVYDGVTKYNDEEVMIVKFWPNSRKGRFHGKLFIDVNDYAVIKAEYFPDTSRSNFWTDVRWTEEFVYRNGRWFLSRVSYEGDWFENDETFHFESLLVVNEVETVEGPPAMGLLIGKNDVFFEEVENEMYKEEFWRGFSYVKLRANEIEDF